jgi:hypothetical protein
MVAILVHGNNHFIVSGPIPDECHRIGSGTGLSPKLVSQNQRLSASGKLGPKDFARTWSGR